MIALVAQSLLSPQMSNLKLQSKLKLMGTIIGYKINYFIDMINYEQNKEYK